MSLRKERTKPSGYAPGPAGHAYDQKGRTGSSPRHVRGSPLIRECLVIFGAITLSVILLRTMPVSGEETGDIVIDPIGDHRASDPFEISGTTTIPSCKQVGIEIFEKQYWEYAWNAARQRDAKGFRIRVPTIMETIANVVYYESDLGVYGAWLMIFNTDGTCTYRIRPPCPDHRIRFAPVHATPDGIRHWKSSFNEDGGEKKMHRNRYMAFVWDATNQKVYADVNIANLYDAREKKIYPTTSSGKIWEPRNHKELFSRNFSLR